MEGIFIKPISSKIGSWLVIISGAVLALLFGFLFIVDDAETTSVVIGSIAAIIYGIANIIGGTLALLFNRKAYIRMAGNHISAHFNWCKKLECDLADISYVNWRPSADLKTTVLTIETSNGKKWTIHGLANAEELCLAIKSQIGIDNKKPHDKSALLAELHSVKQRRKKEIIMIIVGFAVIVVSIFLTVYLTDGKELHQFDQNDWIAFSIIGSLALLLLIMIFVLANSCGKKLTLIDKLQSSLRYSAVITTPLNISNAIAVYTDIDHEGRIAVYGYPSSEEVYYAVETVDAEFNLTETYRSDIFENIRDLTPMLDEFQDISDKFGLSEAE